MTEMRQGFVGTQPAAAATFAFGPLPLNMRDPHPKDDHTVELSQFYVLVGPDRARTDGADQPRFLPCLLPRRFSKLETMLKMSLGQQPASSTAGRDQADSAMPHGKDRRL